MDAASSFYDEFYSYYGIPVPSMQTAQPSLPPRPGASQLRPPPPIPFHSRPIPSAQLSLAPAPIPQSRNPFLAAPLPIPPFNPLPTNPFLRMDILSGNNGPVSPATSSTGVSDFDITSPVPLEGRVPPFPNPFAGAAPVMGALTQDQLLQALNVHFHNTNQILDQLATHAATVQVAAVAPTAKKYIALPEGFDGNPKHWRVFKGQCDTYIQANAAAFQSDDDMKWFLLSHMNKGTALEIVDCIRNNLPHYFDNKTYCYELCFFSLSFPAICFPLSCCRLLHVFLYCHKSLIYFLLCI